MRSAADHVVHFGPGISDISADPSSLDPEDTQVDVQVPIKEKSGQRFALTWLMPSARNHGGRKTSTGGEVSTMKFAAGSADTEGGIDGLAGTGSVIDAELEPLEFANPPAPKATSPRVSALEADAHAEWRRRCGAESCGIDGADMA